MTRKYTKSGKPRKPYTRRKPYPHGPRKPGLAREYMDAFNLTQSFEGAAKLFGVTPNAIKLYFKRNGIEIIKHARKREPK
jgi:hypothetical protein